MTSILQERNDSLIISMSYVLSEVGECMSYTRGICREYGFTVSSTFRLRFAESKIIAISSHVDRKHHEHMK